VTPALLLCTDKKKIKNKKQHKQQKQQQQHTKGDVEHFHS
jgi:hypothetical protein